MMYAHGKGCFVVQMTQQIARIKMNPEEMPTLRKQAMNSSNAKHSHGSKPDFDNLIKENGKYIRTFIAKRTWNESDVDDIYQTTLLEAFKSYKNFREESHPRTWMCGIAAKVISNYIRKKSSSRQSFTDDITSISDSAEQDNETGSETFQNPAMRYEYGRLLGRLNSLYEKLPKSMKDVFDTVIHDGKSYEDASLLHDIPIGTVRSRVSRAREVMKIGL